MLADVLSLFPRAHIVEGSQNITFGSIGPAGFLFEVGVRGRFPRGCEDCTVLFDWRNQ